MACEEVAPVPTYETPHVVVLEGVGQSNSREAVQKHACRIFVSFILSAFITDLAAHGFLAIGERLSCMEMHAGITSSRCMQGTCKCTQAPLHWMNI